MLWKIYGLPMIKTKDRHIRLDASFNLLLGNLKKKNIWWTEIIIW